MIMHQLDARIKRILDELKQNINRSSRPIEGIEIAQREEGVFRPFENGSVWGLDNEWYDFRFTVTVPEDYTDRVVVHVSTGLEGLWDATNPQFVVRVNGRVEQAFDVNHRTLVLQEKAVPNETFEIVLNGYSACKIGDTAKKPYLYVTLDDVNYELTQLIYDIDVPCQAAVLAKEGDRDREVTLETLARAIDLLDIRRMHSPECDASIHEAREYLKTEYYDKRRALVPEAFAESVGHTHIDVAWMWDLYQTRHKAVRSFSTVLKLMELYPEYKFMSSQAALYKFVKDDEPELFKRIQERVKEGRWEVEGGMWVEADCNVAGGESLVRQFLHGQEFFTREFGKQSRILWLPDVFGYSAALPQILKLSGIDYFMTTKLSWSEFNMSPYDTFLWKGMDGSEVLTHFSPSRDYGDSNFMNLMHFTTYNTMLNPKQVAGGWQRYQQKLLDNHYLVCYGYGDGGGGSTDWMVENARRMQVPLPETPVVRQQHGRPFFEELKERVKDDPRLPKWSGELYLEYHRGTYTAMARNKRSNRKIELKLRDVELWCSRAARETSMEYPAQTLHDIWEDVLTLQFHDILPGSSIKKVYDDSKEMYEKMFAQLDELERQAIDALSKGTAGDVLAYNSLAHERDDVIFFDAPEGTTALVDAAGRRYPVQFVEGKAAAYVCHMKPMTETPFWFSCMPVDEADMCVDEKRFDTPFFRGEFGADMRIVSLIDKRVNRQIVKPGQALNRMVCYENKPQAHDAWDVSIFYNRRHWEVNDLKSVEIVSRGPVMTVLRAKYAYMSSTIMQDIVFYQNIDRIDFKTTVDWKEQQYLLKAHFPVDVFYNEATYDIQYGNIKRATHKNTSWDVARFEVCAHKWVDVSEDGFGVSLLNDCKYGHSADENGVALTMLKSSTYPNPEADQEMHYFTYSLMPHAGGWREADVPEMAYRLNVPALIAKGEGQAMVRQPFAAVQQENVQIEAVKQALNGQGTVVRVYENFGRRTSGVQLKLSFAPESAQICNLLEQPQQAADLTGDVITFDLRPYEIKSFLIR